MHVTADKGTGNTSHIPVADLAYCYANANANANANTNLSACSTATTADRTLLQSSEDNLTGAWDLRLRVDKFFRLLGRRSSQREMPSNSSSRGVETRK